MRKALENPVAVYSFWAVNPGSPQSHVGPVARSDTRPHTRQKTNGMPESKISIPAIPAVETVPACGVPADTTKPFEATRLVPARSPRVFRVMGSKTGRNQLANKPS